MEVALALIALVLIPNLWATWKVSRSDLGQLQKTMLIIGTWLVPLLGSYIALQELRGYRRHFDEPAALPRATFRRDAPLSRLNMPGQEPFELRDHLLESTGPPILDFAALDAWAGQAATSEAIRKAREDGHHAWLLLLRHWLGKRSELVEVHECRVLSSYSPGVASATGRYMAESRKRIQGLLDGLAKFPQERATLITLDRDEDYYTYIANYYPKEGEFAFSSGMFINAGCPHLVAVRSDLSQLEPVIAHEMTHFALAHLEMPLWLDEGLAVYTEHRISSTQQHRGPALDLLEKHHAFWNADTIQQFWTGKSFHRTDEGNGLSYDLARALVELLGRDWNAFLRFAPEASREDGGGAAAHGLMQLDLGAVAAGAINMQSESSWAPRPEAWNGVSVKARAGSGAEVRAVAAR